jgi:histone H3/H4
MIVQSHVKETLSKMGLRCGGDFCDALAKACEDLVKKAAWRCKENKRQTVYGCDC